MVGSESTVGALQLYSEQVSYSCLYRICYRICYRIYRQLAIQIHSVRGTQRVTGRQKGLNAETQHMASRPVGVESRTFL